MGTRVIEPPGCDPTCNISGDKVQICEIKGLLYDPLFFHGSGR